MDDYNISSLNSSQYEWGIKLLNVLVPHIVEGIDSIFSESLKICKENKEQKKYLMTFQNLLSRIPKWNNSIIETETTRIVERSKCLYLEDLISCVHISHLKILTSVRVGKTQKKLKIDVPNLKDFIHKVYINCGRQLYTIIYLFEQDVQPLIKLKNKKEIEENIKTCILNSIRESIPVEEILRAYMDESTDLISSVNKEIIKEEVQEPDNMSELKKTDSIAPPSVEDTSISVEDSVPSVEDKPHKVEETSLIKLNTNIDSYDKSDDPVVKKIDTPIVDPDTKLSFSEMDKTIDVNRMEEIVPSPKDIETLEKISNDNHIKRKEEEEEDDDDYNDEKLSISNDSISLDVLDINDIGQSLNTEHLLSEVEVIS
tara:strand:+ start:1237 stop:2349 length:1113 start_codon:yes stop_codon:yes gene_type:complete